MLRTAMPATLLAGLLLLPTPPARATPICVIVSVVAHGIPVSAPPVCVPYPEPTICGPVGVDVGPEVTLVVLLCLPSP